MMSDGATCHYCRQRKCTCEEGTPAGVVSTELRADLDAAQVAAKGFEQRALASEREAEARSKEVSNLLAALANREKYIAGEPARTRAAVVAKLRLAGERLFQKAFDLRPSRADTAIIWDAAGSYCQALADETEREGEETKEAQDGK